MSLELSKLKEWFDSPEGKASVKEFAEKWKRDQEREAATLLRFHNKFKDNIPELIEKVLYKYDQDSYKDRWYKRHTEPCQSWLWQLLDYAKEYGEEVSHRDLVILDSLSMFTTEAYVLEGYLFERLDGQGSVVHVSKIN